MSTTQKRAVLRWGLITLVGFVSALFGIGIHMATITLVNIKNDIVTKFMYTGRWGAAFCWHFTFTVIFASVSYLFVYYEPAATGSGIPEIKRYVDFCEV
jgi:H+/Cl- antiporter ClcA